MTELLRIAGLSKSFTMAGRRRMVLEGIDLALRQGENLGLVGESGSGKTTLALCCLRLLVPDAGTVTFCGQDLSRLSAPALRRLRRRIQMVFQGSLDAFDPRLPLAEALAEPLRIHGIVDDSQMAARTAALLAEVGLAAGLRTRYPHQISGGQRQRLGIARALATEPQLLILDEPVSALDVSVRAQILRLLDGLKGRRDLTMMFISHDLATVAQVADRLAVMYEGRLLEMGSTRRLCEGPAHPYTEALFAAVPSVDPRHRSRSVVASASAVEVEPGGGGCPYLPRCARAAGLDATRRQLCRSERPVLRPVTERAGAPVEGAWVACHYPMGSNGVRGESKDG